ncbi:MAG: DUF4258 domain-containing protein [Chromatiaceae bacterium]|nr:DUF4258 domain-containing protein [Chromatiaceae bacterium]
MTGGYDTDFVLTEHARKRCFRRGISLEWVRQALNYPARTDNDAHDESLACPLSCSRTGVTSYG